MNIRNNDIITTVAELRSVMQHILNYFPNHSDNEQINLRVMDNGDVDVWQPITKARTTEQVFKKQRFPVSDEIEYDEPQPTDIA